MHSVNNIFRRVELAVCVRESDVSEFDPGVEKGEMENAVGGRTEIADLTDDDGSSQREIVGWIGAEWQRSIHTGTKC